MVVRILIGFAVVTVLILLGLWLATGGAQEIVNVARNITNPFSFIFSGQLTSFHLPWQPATTTRGPIVNSDEDSGAAESGKTPEEELEEAEQQYQKLLDEARSAQNFGEPSAYRGLVTIAQGGADETGARDEYLELGAGWENTAPVKISGWSVQSALTGLRAYIPRGAHPFNLGSVNVQSDIYLEPGDSAILSTASSPVGTSFRENACTGYLASAQSFTPQLERSCPTPSGELPFSAENIKTYGESCVEFVETVSACTFPTRVPANLSSQCRLFLANNLSYNGCVQNHKHESNFARDSWRIYLNAGGELWRNSHDIIRLLDTEGRTVDMASY